MPLPRYATIDGLRGAAVMGIVLMNVAAFAMPFAAYDNPAAYGAMRPIDVGLWAIQFVLVDGKMRAIFSALFGASLLLVVERAEAGGRRGGQVHYARMITLLAIGGAHACLLWDGDILVLYALVGMVAFPLRRLPVERLLVLAGMLLLFQMAVLGLHYQGLAALERAATPPGAGLADMAMWRDVLDQIGRPSDGALGADLAVHRGPWIGLVRFLAAEERDGLPYQLLFDGPETLGLMLLGMAGLKSGFLTGAWTGASYRKCLRVAYLAGLPPLAVMAAVLIMTGFSPLLTAFLTECLTTPLRWLVALGHAALLVAWFAGNPTMLKVRVAAAGRCALSNYLGTSLLMAALFDGWGLGLYGRLGRVELLAPVLATWALMLLWSAPWLARHAHGPLEAVWRALVRLIAGTNRTQGIANQSQ